MDGSRLNLTWRNTYDGGAPANVFLNAVVVTVPGSCAGPPGTPPGALASSIGLAIFVIWDAPSTGSAATMYEVILGGAFDYLIPTVGRSLSGAVPSGTYHLSVVARNACGSSPATPAQTVTIQ